MTKRKIIFTSAITELKIIPALATSSIFNLKLYQRVATTLIAKYCQPPFHVFILDITVQRYSQLSDIEEPINNNIPRPYTPHL